MCYLFRRKKASGCARVLVSANIFAARVKNDAPNNASQKTRPPSPHVRTRCSPQTKIEHDAGLLALDCDPRDCVRPRGACWGPCESKGVWYPTQTPGTIGGRI